MKVTSVKLIGPLGMLITAISCGKEVSVSGSDINDVAKKAMKIDHYFTRDKDIAEDIKLVLFEQMQGLREDPNAPGVLLAAQLNTELVAVAA